MTPRRLELREHQTLTDIELSVAEAAFLSQCPAKLEVRFRARGRYDVRASSTVGALSGAGMQVFITPKIPISRLLYLLTFSDHPIVATQDVPHDTEVEFVASLAALYANSLDRALARGIVLDYRPAVDALISPRGRIDATALVTRRFGIVPPVDCAFDEFTADNEVNRRLLAAAVVLTKVGDVTPSVRAQLLRSAARLIDVTETRFDRRLLQPLDPDRRYAQYGSAPRLAELVLRRGSIEFRHGEIDATGLLVDMDDLYEDFVSEALRVAVGASKRDWVRKPARVFLDEERSIELHPDIVWYSGRRPLLLIDVKYKRTVGALATDMYQVTSYCHAFGVSTAVLLYGAAAADEHHVVRGGPTIYVRAVDPNGAPADIRERMATIAHWLRSLVEERQAASVST